MMRHALRSVFVLSVTCLLFACGSETGDATPEALSLASRSLSLSKAQLLCSDGPAIAAGGHHTVGLKSDGTVVAVGHKNYDQLNVSSWRNISAIAGGTYHTLGLRSDGTVTAVGYSGSGQLKVSDWTNIEEIAAGLDHTVGLKNDGTVIAVGYSGAGTQKVTDWINVKAVAAGKYHTVGLKEDGTVVAAGYSGYGQLKVSAWTHITAIAAGGDHTVGLKDDGTVVATGNDGSGQLKVSAWTDIIAIAAGGYHTVGLKKDGTVVAVGWNAYKQLEVSSWTNITAIAAGEYHTVGLKADGTVVAAGSNGYKQLEVSPLFTDIMPRCGSASAASQDATPPITKATVTGTLGDNGWYVSAVQIALTATDGEDGSGVKEIQYSIDGTLEIAPGSPASLSLMSDGTHTVVWSAIDNAGNVEFPQVITINIDTTPPSTPSLSVDPPILWPPNRKIIDVMLGGWVDDGGSGIASTIITLSDEYGIYSGTVPDLRSVIRLESWRAGSDMDGRLYTITAVTKDKAGNQSTGTATVLVPHDMKGK